MRRRKSRMKSRRKYSARGRQSKGRSIRAPKIGFRMN